MTADSSAIPLVRPVVPGGRSGLWWGLVGVTAFSLTVPLTRLAVAEASPLFLGAGRAVVAAVLAATALLLARQRRPSRRQVARLAAVAGGVVVGFPLLTSFALVTVPAAHAAVVIALLPAATAATAVLRTGERPPARFWLLASLGAAVTVGFVAVEGGGLGGLHPADLLLLGAVAAAAVGYAEGGLLARELGAWQTVSWALVLAAPVMAVLTAVALPGGTPTTPVGWAAFAYLGAVSMFLGFVAWYRGLARGPMAQVSQVQLVQPVMSIAWAALLLGEAVSWATLLGGLLVVGCAGSAVRVRLGTPRPPAGGASPGA